MMIVLLMSITILSAAYSTPMKLGDDNFQRITLIGKHIPLTKWYIAFCEHDCPKETTDVLEKLN